MVAEGLEGSAVSILRRSSRLRRTIGVPLASVLSMATVAAPLVGCSSTSTVPRLQYIDLDLTDQGRQLVSRTTNSHSQCDYDGRVVGIVDHALSDPGVVYVLPYNLNGVACDGSVLSLNASFVEAAWIDGVSYKVPIR